ncbi:MAG: hypothetical protein J7604_21245 [Sporocytophaga sp.]|uniref:hypothetical protein n=1 Tax=Sporocytophaga sp. TaxID=2231183 RepID=UPI001B0D433D|nr:hypothetical protein [Sporocytophaga sp.]MBO9702752.1 hypothetical protein [Sporocytophaga sp.]
MSKIYEITEKIDRYLSDKLSETEKLQFEKMISEDPGLQESVELQREVMNGVEGLVLKQKVSKAYHRFKLTKVLIKAGLISLGIIAVVLAVAIFRSSKHHTHSSHPHKEKVFDSKDIKTEENHSLPIIELSPQEVEKVDENIKKDLSEAGQSLQLQLFTLNSEKDTVIQTNAGTVLSIPASCFINENGKPIKGEIQLTFKEAMDAASIMKSGLTSTTDGALLESAGMFFISARHNGQELKIDSLKNIYAEVPTNNKRGDMQLFDGVHTNDGKINWVKPKPLSNYLTPVDIHSLNFYPPAYLDSLAKWGYNVRDKKFTDSLYYSFAGLFVKVNNLEPKEEYVPEDTSVARDNQETPVYKNNQQRSKLGFVTNDVQAINPGKIKAIWNDRFQKTLIATREFQERIPFIHKTCDSKILDLYVKNLNKPISAIDLMAAQQLNGELKKVFLDFASRKEGKVNVRNSQMEKLREFYSIQAKAVSEAAFKTEEAIRQEQNRLERIAQKKKATHVSEDKVREIMNLQEEYDLNLTEACRQLGIIKPVFASTQVYGFSIRSNGWKNIDRLVWEAAVNRTTFKYSAGGKKAEIKYLPFSVKLNEYKQYDRIYVYLLADKLNSFMRLQQDNDLFKEQLNELMKYKMVCLGFKGDKLYFSEVENVESKVYEDIILKEIDEKILNQKLNSLKNLNQLEGIVKEVDYWKSELQEEKRRKKERDRRNFRVKVMRVIFPCALIPSDEEVYD